MILDCSTISLETTDSVELIDITGELQRQLQRKRIADGCLLVFTRHTTSGIWVNENERGLLRDVKQFLQNLAPPREGYAHDAKHSPGTKNAHSHLQSLCIGPQVTLPVKDHQLLLGTWQSVFFVELDGPRNREVVVQIIGE